MKLLPCSLVALLLATATPALANDLSGVWIFQKETNATPAGEEVQVPGPAYEGVLIYTPDGYVSANLMPKDRSWNVDTAKAEELRESFEGSSTGYAGRYEVDVEAGTVVHIPSVSLDPADTGRKLVRSYTLDKDTLKLSGHWQYQGRDLVFTVFWIRADNAPQTTAGDARKAPDDVGQ